MMLGPADTDTLRNTPQKGVSARRTSRLIFVPYRRWGAQGGSGIRAIAQSDIIAYRQ